MHRVTLVVGIIVAWAIGTILHEFTHYAVARLTGADNVQIKWSLYKSYVYYEADSDVQRRIINLAPQIIGVGYVVFYIAHNGFPEATVPALIGVGFLGGYAGMGGLEDYSLSRARS